MSNDDSKFWPFSTTDPGDCYGPGPKGQKNCRADRWRCKCEQKTKDLSVCKCVGIRPLPGGGVSKARKTVRIDLKKKREYQKKLYRPFLKRKRQRR